MATLLAGAPLISLTGCGWSTRYSREVTDDWLNVLDALDPGLEPGSVPAALTARLRDALEQIRIVPRMFADVAHIDPTTVLFGRTLQSPILAGRHAAYDDSSRQLEVLLGAHAASTIAIVSDAMSVPPAHAQSVKEAAPWMVCSSATSTETSLARAGVLGAGAIVVSLDTPWTQSALTNLCVASALPVVASGVVDAMHAQRVMDAGVRGIIVAAALPVAPILRLREIVTAVSPGTPVMIANEFTRGTDILKALALGASAVLVDLPISWGLASADIVGVARVLELLDLELAHAMTMAKGGKYRFVVAEPGAHASQVKHSRYDRRRTT
ncbi:MAG: alpha-hydroxy-acid oxidizing protein [Gemmatimonadaceae bacterium]|nr:alpha-hydroxy-acid oxidizing protein [Gemmatimonadaceae bacterium]